MHKSLAPGAACGKEDAYAADGRMNVQPVFSASSSRNRVRCWLEDARYPAEVAFACRPARIGVVSLCRARRLARTHALVGPRRPTLRGNWVVALQNRADARPLHIHRFIFISIASYSMGDRLARYSWSRLYSPEASPCCGPVLSINTVPTEAWGAKIASIRGHAD